jgi:AraC family transcriptional regulator
MSKTQIFITQTFCNKDIPAAPDNAVLLSSNGKWNGFKFEEHVLAPAEMPEHVIKEHRLIVNIGQPVFFEWKKDSKWIGNSYPTGAFTLLSQGEIHQPRWDKDFDFIAIAISPEFADNLVEVNNVAFIEQRGVFDPFISQLSTKMHHELKEESFAGKIYGESIAIAFILHIIANYLKNKGSRFLPKGKLTATQLGRIIEYSNSFLNMNIGLNDMASQVNLSPYHLAHLFKNTLGTSPYRYLLQLKCERAKYLIKNKNMSFTEIAYELGFSDQAHFSNSFKRTFGISPRQYFYS